MSFPIMGSSPRSPVFLRWVYSTSIVTSYLLRLVTYHKSAGHNPGTDNQQRHGAAICRCCIDSERLYGLPLPASVWTTADAHDPSALSIHVEASALITSSSLGQPDGQLFHLSTTYGRHALLLPLRAAGCLWFVSAGHCIVH
jgi:hypothetical protein